MARGKVVDTEALVEALQQVAIHGNHLVIALLLSGMLQGQIAMAALDVTEPEPLPQGHPLLGILS